MALSPTIYKCRVMVSDFNRELFDSLALTVAQHPSETLERMMVRLLARCLHGEEALEFTRGLSSTEEPDLWTHALDGRITRWVEVGEPQVERVKKATRLAECVEVYSFNTKSRVWWQQQQEQLSSLPVAVYQFAWAEVQSLTGLVERTMDLDLSIVDDTIRVTSANGACELRLYCLQPGLES